MTTVHPTADIDDGAHLGEGTRVWQFAHICANAVLGLNCTVGRGAYIGNNVEIGDNCKIQNYALVYEPAKLASGVFIGPSVVLTNDLYPRAVSPDGSLKSTDDWQPVGVTIGEGASIGARAVCIAPVSIGQWAMIAAGSVVTKNVPSYALVVGNPAQQIGWVGPSGLRLDECSPGKWRCPQTGSFFVERDGELVATQL